MPRADIRNFDEAFAWMESRYPSIINGMQIDRDVEGELSRIRAEIFESYLEVAAGKGRPIEDGLEAIARMTFDFIRLQSRFMRTGRYRRSSADEIYRNFYSNDSYMNETYLDGLFLSYAFWPNHVRMMQMFRNSFLPRIQEGARVIEIGIGPGLMASELCIRHPGATYRAVDISCSSSAWAENALEALGVSRERFQFVEADACGDSFSIDANAFDAGICCEVMEHVEGPEKLLSNLRSSLKRGASVFLSTVANIEADDHIYRFRDRDHIHSVISHAGFDVIEELPMPLRGLEDASPRPLVYAAVATAARPAV